MLLLLLFAILDTNTLLISNSINEISFSFDVCACELCVFLLLFFSQYCEKENFTNISIQHTYNMSERTFFWCSILLIIFSKLTQNTKYFPWRHFALVFIFYFRIFISFASKRDFIHSFSVSPSLVRCCCRYNLLEEDLHHFPLNICQYFAQFTQTQWCTAENFMWTMKQMWKWKSIAKKWNENKISEKLELMLVVWNQRVSKVINAYAFIEFGSWRYTIAFGANPRNRKPCLCNAWQNAEEKSFLQTQYKDKHQ